MISHKESNKQFTRVTERKTIINKYFRFLLFKRSWRYRQSIGQQPDNINDENGFEIRKFE